MTTLKSQSPLYFKISHILIGLLAFSFILYIGKDIIVPIIFSLLVAILLNPLVNFLVKHRCNRVIAIILVVMATLLLIFGILFFIISQASLLSESLPALRQKFFVLLDDLIYWISENFNINKPKIDSWLSKTEAEGLKNSTAIIGSALSACGDILILLLLVPVYIFMILFYKPHLMEFIRQLSKNDNNEIVNEVMTESKGLIQKYLIGLLLEAVIVAVLNAAGLLVLGIDYAILIGVIGALLNLVPYIGGIVAIGIPMMLALATKQPIDALWVLILYSIVQFIDNNFIVPKIVASKVKINGFISIIVVIIGGAIWGVAGMFLAIPLSAILKVIFDRVEPLKPLGFLLGDSQPEIIGKFRRRKKAT